MNENKMAEVAKLFGKKLGEEFKVNEEEGRKKKRRSSVRRKC